MIQSIQADNIQRKGKLSTLGKDATNLTNKTQSMTEGAKTLTERICTVECINCTLSNDYDIFTDRMSLQEVNMHL